MAEQPARGGRSDRDIPGEEGLGRYRKNMTVRNALRFKDPRMAGQLLRPVVSRWNMHKVEPKARIHTIDLDYNARIQGLESLGASNSFFFHRTLHLG